MFKYADYAYEVYKEKSFTKAAENLFISQPSLSLTIKKLENSLGAPIFDRSAREIVLTDIGEKYISAVLEIKNLEKSLRNEIDDLQKLKKGTITIGSTIFVSSYILPDILRKFKSIFPLIVINIIVEQSSVLENMLENGSVDFIIDNALLKQNQYQYIPVMKERILVAVPKAFAVNDKLKENEIFYSEIKRTHNWYENKSKINISELKKENFILLKHGNKMRKITNNIFKENNISPDVVYEFDHLMTSISYAEARFGICFLTDMVLKYAKKLKDISLYLPDTLHSERTLYIIRKQNKYHSFATNELIKCITDFLK